MQLPNYQRDIVRELEVRWAWFFRGVIKRNMKNTTTAGIAGINGDKIKECN